MVQNINLVPQEEIHEQNKTEVVKFSSIATVILLVIVSIASAYLYYRTSLIKKENKELQGQIEVLRNEINANSAMEIDARTLTKKSDLLKDYLATRPIYSRFMKEFVSRQVPTVEIESFDFDDATINVSGASGSYAALSEYIETLLGNRNITETSIKDMYTQVSLNNARLEENTGKVGFALKITYNRSKLYD